MFNLQSRYLALGDQLDDLVGDLDWGELDQFGATPATFLFVLAMVTVFQFSEDLDDREAASAARTRMDWKYALHLPVDYPGFAPGALAEFRQHLEHDPAGRRIFQELLVRLARLGLLMEQTDVATVLSTVGVLNCLKEVSEAMNLALEALASGEPDWLRAVASPYWYQRYGLAPSSWHVPHTEEGRRAILEALESDIASLLAVIAEDRPALLRWPEVRALDRLWQNKFGRETETSRI